MAELVLAVLRPDHDDPPARWIGHRAPRQVGHVRVQVAPLGGQQIDDIDVLGGGLQEGRRRREEVDVRVGGDPAPGVEVDRPVERQTSSVARRGLHLEPCPRRGPVEPADDLDVDRAGRQLDGEPAGDIGIGGGPEDEVAAGVLEERRVDLVAMADRRQVAPVGGGEADPARDRLAGRSVHDLDLDRDARRRQHLDRAGPGRITLRARGQQLARRHVPVVEADDGVLADRQVDDAGPRSASPASPGRAASFVPARRGRPQPTIPPSDVPAAASSERPRPDDRSQVDLGRPTAEALDPDRHARAAGQRVGRAAVDGHGGQDHVAPRPAVGQRLETKGDRLAASGSRRMAWSHRSASPPGLGTKSDIPTWLPPYVPGMIVSDPDCPGGA